MRFIFAAATSLLLLAPSVGLASGPRDLKSAGFDKATLDTTCKPCEDFNQYANGGWLKQNPTPAAYPMWGVDNLISDRNEAILKKVLEDSAKVVDAKKGSVEQKVGDFYAAAMDTEKIESDGIKPLEPELAKIAAITDVASLQAEVAQLQMHGVNALFQFGSWQDAKDSASVIAIVWQGGLGLPDRDYYTSDDAKMASIREGYVAHVTKIFQLAGEDAAKAAADAKTVMAIETAFAKAQMTRVETRDPEKTYHKMTRADLKTATANWSWETYLAAVGAPAATDVNFGQPEYVKAFDGLVKSTPIADWQTYLRWQLLHWSAPYVSSAFVDENFAFFGKTLTGTEEILPRWKRVEHVADRTLGELLGQAYVKTAFTPDAKRRALDMVNDLKAALREDLGGLEWMSEATRKQAIAKLDTFLDKIGYPDTWRDYSALEVDRGAYVLNVSRASAFEWRRDAAKIGKPVDRLEWGMTPPTVNAYYNPSNNEICFPAGILQPPYFDPSADDAFNYGGIGAVIGHEMTHGFDDQGAQFDSKGNLKNWWTESDLKNFKDRAKCVSDQFDAFQVQDLHENGPLVVGESIADLGGLVIAYRAYQKHLEGKPHDAIDGFSPEQRFFLGYARSWATNARPEFERLMVTTNEHPLPRFRVNGPLANMPEFRAAWGCKSGDKMVRDNSCRIW